MPPKLSDPVAQSITAHKGHITRRVRAIQSLLPAVPNLTSVQEALRDEVKKLAGQYTEIEKLYDQYTQQAIARGDSDEELAKISQRQDEVAKVCQDAKLLAFNALATVTPATNAPGPQAQAAPVPAPPMQLDIADSIKPEPLGLSHTPDEFRLWREQFEAYHGVAQLDRFTNDQQRVCLAKCLDKQLVIRLRDACPPGTPVMGATASCLAALSVEFTQKYPLFQRRHDFFKCTQQPGQSMSDFLAQLHQRGREADLQNMGVDDIYAFRYITGSVDAKLQGLLLKEVNPSLEKLKTLILNYETRQSSLDSLQPTAVAEVAAVRPIAEVAAVRPTQGKQKSKGLRTPKPGQKCFRCASSEHLRPDCPLKKEAVSCLKCGKQGHVKEVCQSKGSVAATESPEVASVGPDASVNEVRPSIQSTPLFGCQLEHEGRRHLVKAFPDTGSCCTLVSQAFVRRIGAHPEPYSGSLSAVNGTAVPLVGILRAKIMIRGSAASVEAFVCPSQQHDFILSWQDLIRLGIVHPSFPNPIETTAAVAVDEKHNCTIVREMLETYADVFSDTLGERAITGDPMHIHLRQDLTVQPQKQLTARQVPCHLREKADALVQKLMQAGVLAPVDIPTDWISPGHFVPKPNGDVRLVTDYTKLNKYVKRPVHPFPSTKDILQSLSPDTKLFAKVDCTHGYFQVPLDYESSLLTTFLLPSGRFRYTRAPMGLNASSDEFCRRSDLAFNGIPGVSKIVDDGLIQASSPVQLRERLHILLQRCRDHGITLSKKKFAVGTEVTFAGHIIGVDGVRPDPQKVEALSSFPTPTNVTQLRSFLGLAQQLASFVPNLAMASEPLRQLLKKGVVFQWLPEHDTAFTLVKDILTGPLLVQPFDRTLPTELHTDASRLFGIGYLLLQRNKDGTSRLIKCGSRSLLPAEGRYATIELECLAVQYAVQHCHFYLQGADNFSVVTDHQPLVGLFQRSLHDISSPRLQRLREKLMGYNFTLSWVKGKTHMMADALSRSPLPSCNATAVEWVPFVKAVDNEYRELVHALKSDVSDVPPGNTDAQRLKRQWASLTVKNVDGVDMIFRGEQLLVPQSHRQEVLRQLHLGHPGRDKMMQSARRSYFWPGMKNSIGQMVLECEPCQRRLPSRQKERLLTTPDATHPMELVGMDLCTFAGKTYLIMIDWYSGFPFCQVLRSTTTAAILRVIHGWFLLFGFPRVIRSDNGPQFRTEFKEYCTRNGIEHSPSSPYHPSSNGLAESAVKLVKILMEKCAQDKAPFEEHLHALRNIPRKDGVVPAQLFHGRHIRSSLHPDPTQTFLPISDYDRSALLERKREHRQAAYDAINESLPTHSVFHVGDRVLVQNAQSGKWDMRGFVKAACGERSYCIQLSDGREIERNRRFLRLLEPSRCVSPLTTASAATSPTPLVSQGNASISSIDTWCSSTPSLPVREQLSSHSHLQSWVPPPPSFSLLPLRSRWSATNSVDSISLRSTSQLSTSASPSLPCSSSLPPLPTSSPRRSATGTNAAVSVTLPGRLRTLSSRNSDPDPVHVISGRSLRPGLSATPALPAPTGAATATSTRTQSTRTTASLTSSSCPTRRLHAASLSQFLVRLRPRPHAQLSPPHPSTRCRDPPEDRQHHVQHDERREEHQQRDHHGRFHPHRHQSFPSHSQR